METKWRNWISPEGRHLAGKSCFSRYTQQVKGHLISFLGRKCTIIYKLIANATNIFDYLIYLLGNRVFALECQEFELLTRFNAKYRWKFVIAPVASILLHN